LLYELRAFALVIAAFGAFFLYQQVSAPGPFGGHGRAESSTRINARAIDGDSLRGSLGDIRLIGIDAPELFQECRDGEGRLWSCGREAHAFLRSLVSRGGLSCEAQARDRYGRALSRCSVNGVDDIGEAMVRAGYAVAFMSTSHQATEADARAAKRGIWRGTFERPQDWRRRKN
jgi:endonuclease YncB( thermonuclease family)